MKKIGTIVLIVVIIVIASALYFWFSMGKPMYEPGHVKNNTNLVPPKQLTGDNFWLVEKDIRLYHFSFGKGQPILVLHGGPGFPFRKHIIKSNTLNEKYKFIYYDQRGCGKSTIPFNKFESSNYYANIKTLEGVLGITAQLADIERIRRILGVEKLVIIGHSFGAFLASLYAAEFPEQVKALILVAPADVLVLSAKSGGLFKLIEEKLPTAKKEEFQKFLSVYFDFANLFSKSENELRQLNYNFAKYYRMATERINDENDLSEIGGWITQALFLSMGKEHDFRSSLKNVKAPVLILHGESDLQPASASRLYAECFSNSQFDIIDNAGHFIFNDKPKEFAKVIEVFLKNL